MKKSNIISGLLVSSMVVASGMNINAQENISYDRISGKDRIETAIEIAKRFGNSSNVILATGSSYADALVASPLAHKLKAPILLNGKDNLDNRVKSTLNELGCKNIYIVGGESVISQNVEKDLKNSGFVVKRISGNDRYATSVEISKEYRKLVNPKRAIIASGENYPDALVAGPYAAVNEYPILLSKKTVLPRVVGDEIKDIKPEYIIAIGGENSLNPKGVKITERILGQNRYETSLNISTKLGRNNVYITSGDSFADALVVAPLAAKTGSSIVLVPKASLGESTRKYLKRIEKVSVVGGENSVPSRLFTVNNYVKNVENLEYKNSKKIDDKKTDKNKNIRNIKPSVVNHKTLKDKKKEIISKKSEIEARFTELINEYRVSQGRSKLDIDDSKREGIDVRAEEIKRLFSHSRPNGKKFISAFSGIDYASVGENLVAFSFSYTTDDVVNSIAQKAFDLWKKSPGHNKNMLSPFWSKHLIGVSVDDRMIYLVDVFFD